MQKIISLFVALLLFTTLASAQTGTIRGLITEKIGDETGDEVVGATVVIEGTSLGTVSDIEGKYHLRNIKPGKYNLLFSYVGYKKQRMTDVVVESNKITVINVWLEEDVEKLDDVVIIGFRDSDNDVAVIEEVRKSESVANGLSSEQIEKSQDGDAAQAMTRVPGVTVFENRFVMVRGVSDRYNNVMINNVIAPSTEVDIRSFAFDLIPTSALDRMLVYKSGSPEMPGDFAGGMIKVFTKNNVDENSTTISLGTAYRAGTTFQDHISSEGSPTDFLGFDNGFRDLPGNFPSTSALQGSGRASELRQNAGRSLTNNFDFDTRSARPDISLGVSFARKFQWGNALISNITSLNYANSYQYAQIDRFRYFFFDPDRPIQQRFAYQDDMHRNSIRIGFLHNWRAELGDNTVIEFRNMFTQIGENESVIRNGFDFLQRPNDDLRNYSYHYMSRTIYTGQLEGKHTLKENRTTLNWTVGLNYIGRNEPDFRRFRTFRDTTLRETSAPFTMQLPPSANLFETGRFFSTFQEVGVSQGLTYEIILGDSQKESEERPILRTGYYAEYKEREFNARYVSYLYPGFFDPNEGQRLSRLPLDQIFSPENISNQDGFVIEEGTRPTDTYTGNNTLLAAFVGAVIPINRFKASGGLRVEYNNQEIISSDDFGPIRGGQELISPLPFLNLSLDVSERSLVRAAFSSTVNRPDFRELAPFVYYNFDLESGVRGNPELKVATIQNIDARWEFYPNPGEIISIGGFYKSFRNPIESFLQVTTEQPQFTYGNAESAYSYGVELEIRKTFGDLTLVPVLRDMSIVFNAALIESRVDLGAAATAQDQVRPLQGQSPYMLNFVWYYNNSDAGLDINLAYNVIGARIFAVGDVNFPTIYELPRNAIDLTISKSLSENTAVKFGIQDLLNAKYRFFQDSNLDAKIDDVDDPIFQFRRGTQFSVSFAHTMRPKKNKRIAQ